MLNRPSKSQTIDEFFEEGCSIRLGSRKLDPSVMISCQNWQTARDVEEADVVSENLDKPSKLIDEEIACWSSR